MVPPGFDRGAILMLRHGLSAMPWPVVTVAVPAKPTCMLRSVRDSRVHSAVSLPTGFHLSRLSEGRIQRTRLDQRRIVLSKQV